MRLPMRKLQEAAPCAYTPEEADEELSLLEKKCRDDVDYLKSTGWALPGFVLATPRPEEPAAIVENEQLRLRGDRRKSAQARPTAEAKNTRRRTRARPTVSEAHSERGRRTRAKPTVSEGEGQLHQRLQIEMAATK
eukprot:scaffold241_cov242-Pinguiococcus_pyrenoidosus.AAC.1